MAGHSGRPKFLSSLSLIQGDREQELALSRGPLGQRLADLVSQHGLKAVKVAEQRLSLLARLQQLHPKTQLVGDLRVPSEGVRALAQEAQTSVSSLHRWRGKFIRAGKAAEGDPVLAVYLGFTALIDRKKGAILFPATDGRIRVNERLRLLIQGLYSRRTRPSGSKVWNRLLTQCIACRQIAMVFSLACSVRSALETATQLANGQHPIEFLVYGGSEGGSPGRARQPFALTLHISHKSCTVTKLTSPSLFPLAIRFLFA